MMPTRFVIRSQALTASGSDIIVTATTDLPVHLWVGYAPTRPRARTRYKVRRGVLTPCGVTYAWPGWACYEQAELGDTTTHTFTLLDATGDFSPHIAYSTACPPAPGTPATPPIGIIPPSGPIPLYTDTFSRPDGPIGSTEPPGVVTPWTPVPSTFPWVLNNTMAHEPPPAPQFLPATATLPAILHPQMIALQPTVFRLNPDLSINTAEAYPYVDVLVLGPAINGFFTQWFRSPIAPGPLIVQVVESTGVNIIRATAVYNPPPWLPSATMAVGIKHEPPTVTAFIAPTMSHRPDLDPAALTAVYTSIAAPQRPLIAIRTTEDPFGGRPTAMVGWSPLP